MYSFDEIMCIICLSITTAIFLILIERITKNIKRIKELKNAIAEYDEYIAEHATFENVEIV